MVRQNPSDIENAHAVGESLKNVTAGLQKMASGVRSNGDLRMITVVLAARLGATQANAGD